MGGKKRGNKVRKHIGNRGLISGSLRIMDDLFIDRHKSELRAGITHHHHHRRRIDQVVRRERE